MSGRRNSSNDGDWVCSDPKCGNVNFSRRHQCNRCGTAKSQVTIKAGGSAIGKQLAEKSKGLFSADDWQCKTCGNVNWARRNDCNLCKAPKFGKVEARTGYGGGYNERLSVEYKSDKEEDSEGEFDDFGRKKKKFRGSVPPESTETPAMAKDKEDEEESSDEGDLDAYKLDSDDDDDDDGDLSKYDFGDDDPPPSKPAASEDPEKKRGADGVPGTGSPPQRSGSSSSSSSSSSRSSRSAGSRSSSRSSYSRSRSRSRSRSHDRKRRSRSRSPDKQWQQRDSSSSERGGDFKRRRHRSRSR